MKKLLLIICLAMALSLTLLIPLSNSPAQAAPGAPMQQENAATIWASTVHTCTLTCDLPSQ